MRSVVVGLALAGCYSPVVPSEVPCGDGDACPAGQVCDHGRSPPTCVDVLGGDAGPNGPDGNQATIDAAGDGGGPPLPSGNVLRLRFDDDPGDGVIDSTGSHTATCANATCPVLAAGHEGGGYMFSSDHLDIADAADLRPNSGFTIAAWLNASATGGQRMILCKDYFSLAESYALSIRGANARLEFSGTSTSVTGNTIVTTGDWHHAAATWDGTTVRLYLDGDPEGSMQQTMLVADAGGVQIGACHGGQTFAGSLDDVQFYNRALTAAEIAGLASN